MTRNAFRSWGLELTPDEFACALAAAGVLLSRVPIFHGMERTLDALLASAFTEGPLLSWSLSIEPGQLEGLADTLPAHGLMSAWRKNRPAVSPQLLVVSNPASEPVMPWIAEQLSRRTVGLASISVIEQDLLPLADWNWPLRVACLNEPASRRLCEQLASSWGGSLLSRVSLIEVDGEACDILVFPGSLRDAAARLLNDPMSVRASCVAILGGMQEAWHQAQPLKIILQQETRAAGIYLANIPEKNHLTWFNALIEELSHNQPLNASLHRATLRALPGQEYFLSLLFTNAQLLQDSQLGAVAKNLIDELSNLAQVESPPVFSPGGIPGGGVSGIDLPPEAAGPLGLQPGNYPSSLLVEKLGERVDQFRYDQESREASGLAHLSNSLQAYESSARNPNVEPRWIQAQVFDLGSPEKPLPLTRVLRGGAPHALDVRIGPQDTEWLAPPTTAIFPEWMLPESAVGHILKVVFSEPNHAPEPQVQTITLPPRSGPSTTCRFHFQTRGDVSEFEGRIIILHENRVLQTALFRAEVFPLDIEAIGNIEHPAPPLPGATPLDPFGVLEKNRRIELAIETVVRPALVGLESRRRFAAAIVVNRSGDGKARATVTSDERARLLSLEGIKQFNDQIRDKLTEIAWSEKKFARGLKSAETVKLLRFLAIQGSSLYGGIVEDQLGSDLFGEDKPLQVVSALPESFLPVEFIYDRPAPAMDAQLCPQAEKALREGICAGCLDTGEVPNPYICPLGFWGLRRVIERHAGKGAEQGDLRAQEFELRAEPSNKRNRLAPLVSAVYAASQRVDSVEPGQIRRVYEALESATGKNVVQVDSWNSWKDEVLKRNPSILLLLPHIFKDDDYLIDGLEISKDQHLLATYITSDHVHARPDFQPPIVLLLGCETQNRDIPFQGFVAQFRRKGAAIVVSTVSTVLGRHAASVAQELLALLQRQGQQKTSTFGEVMVRLRREALADGIPMVLSLFAYGDADWRIGTD